MTCTQRLVRRFGKGTVRTISPAEMEGFVERMRAATEEQRKADERARAMSEMRARFRWIG